MADDTNEPTNEHEEPDAPGEMANPSDENEQPGAPDSGPDYGDEDTDTDDGVGARTGGPSPQGDLGGATATFDPDDEDVSEGDVAGGPRLTASSNPLGRPSVTSDRLIANEANATIIGVLRAFLADGSTLELPMDGDAALRTISCWAGSMHWAEVCNPVRSTAAASWAALDLDLVVGLLWIPGLPRERFPRRMTVDPAAA